NQRHGAALVIFANSFARARSGNAGTNDEIITPNHMRTRTIISPLPRRQAKSLKVLSRRVSAVLGLVLNILSAYGSPRSMEGRGRVGRSERQPDTSGVSGPLTSILSRFRRREKARRHNCASTV